MSAASANSATTIFGKKGERGNYYELLMKHMKDLYFGGLEAFFETGDAILVLSDVFEALNKIPENTFDMIFADPPYFLSNNEITCQGGKMVSVNKGDWDKADSLDEKHEFNRRWLRECKRVLKPNGSIWISGTLHNIYSVGMALEKKATRLLRTLPGKKLIRHQTWHVDVLPIVQKPYCGPKRQIRRVSIYLIMKL